VALGWQSVRLTARGVDSRAVVVKRLRPKILERSPAAQGWYVFPERGGGLDVRSFAADLDEPSPVAFLVSEARGKDLPQPTATYDFSVTQSDVESWELTVFTTAGVVRWMLEVDYEISGQHRTKALHDSRFVLTGEGPGQWAFSWDGVDAWQDMGERREDVSRVARYLRERLKEADRPRRTPPECVNGHES
jgi:hypothetical protein